MGNETNEKMPFSIGSQENSLVSSGHSPFCLDTPVNGSPLSGSAPALPGSNSNNGGNSLQNSGPDQSQQQQLYQQWQGSSVTNSNFPRQHQTQHHLQARASLAAAIAAAKAKRIEQRTQQKPAIVAGNGLASAEMQQQLQFLMQLQQLQSQQWGPSNCSTAKSCSSGSMEIMEESNQMEQLCDANFEEQNTGSSSTPLSFLDDAVSVETMEEHCEEESDNWVQISVDHPAEIVENTSNSELSPEKLEDRRAIYYTMLELKYTLKKINLNLVEFNDYYLEVDSNDSKPTEQAIDPNLTNSNGTASAESISVSATSPSSISDQLKMEPDGGYVNDSCFEGMANEIAQSLDALNSQFSRLCQTVGTVAQNLKLSDHVPSTPTMCEHSVQTVPAQKVHRKVQTVPTQDDGQSHQPVVRTGSSSLNTTNNKPIKAYVCANCKTYLTNKSQTSSITFRGATGIAFLFRSVTNLTFGKNEARNMSTGVHVVRDVSCKGCGTMLGWTYEFALEPGQTYKEGQTVLERQLIESVEGTEYTELALQSHASDSSSTTAKTMKVWEVVDGLWQKIPLTGSTLRNHFRKMAEEKKLELSELSELQKEVVDTVTKLDGINRLAKSDSLKAVLDQCREELVKVGLRENEKQTSGTNHFPLDFSDDED